MKNKFSLLLFILMCSAMLSKNSFAFGIDNLSANLDAGSNFKSVESFTLFNESGDSTAFVTAQGLTWKMTEDDQMLTKPTDDLQIFPPVMRIPAGGSGTFKVRYSGLPISGEGTYRISFKQIGIPNVPSGGKEAELSDLINNQATVGMVLTVPVYVSDFSKKTDVLKQVSATFNQQEKSTELTVENGGDRHITILDYRINGVERGMGLGYLLAKHKHPFVLDVTDPVASVDIKVGYKDQSVWVKAVVQ